MSSPKGRSKGNRRDAAAKGADEWLECSGAALRAKAPFIRMDAIQAGDVVLVRGEGSHAKVAAVGSNGLYSHAAIWLPVPSLDGAPPLLLLAEADPHGVGPTLPDWMTLYREGHPAERVVSFQGATHLVLLRHPALAKMPPEDLLAATERLSKREFYRAYSRWERLVEISFLPRWLRPVMRGAARLFDRRKHYDPGAFCSELVAKFFDELGVSLFTSAVDPATIEPSRLIAADSRLALAPGVPVFWPHDLEGATVRHWTAGRAAFHDRATTLPATVKQREGLRRTMDGLKSFEAAVVRVGVEQTEAARARSEAMLEGLRTQAFAAEPWHPTVVRSTGARLMSRAETLHKLNLKVAALDTLKPAEFSAKLALAEHQAMLANTLTYQGCRRQTLATLAALRKTRADRRKRRQLLDHWRSLRQGRTTTHGMIVSFKRPTTPVEIVATLEGEPRAIVSAIFGSL